MTAAAPASAALEAFEAAMALLSAEAEAAARGAEEIGRHLADLTARSEDTRAAFHRRVREAERLALVHSKAAEITAMLRQDRPAAEGEIPAAATAEVLRRLRARDGLPPLPEDIVMVIGERVAAAAAKLLHEEAASRHSAAEPDTIGGAMGGTTLPTAEDRLAAETARLQAIGLGYGVRATAIGNRQSAFGDPPDAAPVRRHFAPRVPRLDADAAQAIEPYPLPRECGA